MTEVQGDLDDINERVPEPHDADIEALREEYMDIAARMQRWKERAEVVWHAIADDLQAEAPDLDDVEWPEPAEGDEDDDPLFDSTRDYVEQIDRHKGHQGRRTERLGGEPRKVKCAQCGKTFLARRKHARACSPKCGNQLYHAKKRMKRK